MKDKDPRFPRNYIPLRIDMVVREVSKANAAQDSERPHLGGYLSFRDDPKEPGIQVFSPLIPRPVIHIGDTATLRPLGSSYMVESLKRDGETYYEHDLMVKYLNS